nr:sigma-70 family RNA polymerase sigma factor [Halobacillus sp. KGW1]
MEQSIEKYTMLEDKERAIAEIMHTYGDDVLRLVYTYVRNQAIAEDLTQEIFIKCYTNLHKYNGTSKLKTWLWRIAINQCKDYLKSWYNRKVIAVGEETLRQKEEPLGTEEKVVRGFMDVELIAAVMQLPPKYREVIYLYYYEEMTAKEIGNVTKKSENTIKTRLKRAKELLENQLGGDLYDG